VTGREAPEDTRALDLLLLPPHSDRSEHARGHHRSAGGHDCHSEGSRGPPPALTAGPQKRALPGVVHDDTGEMALTFFHSKRQWLEKILPEGETVLVSGKVEWFNGRPSMVHPDHIALEADADSFPLIEPVYPLTAGLSPKCCADRSKPRWTSCRSFQSGPIRTW
jgi:ATP-dependent DNA helicase RecG